MGIKTVAPVNSSRRFQTFLTKEEITTKEPYKPLTWGKRRIHGRNSDGHITVRHRGRGHKRLYRVIDFRRDKLGVPARVATIEYDPNRSAFIALLSYLDGEKRYILAPHGLQVGQTVMAGPEADILVGNALPIQNIPIGTTIHNIELRPGKGGQLVRSAGGAAQLLAKEEDYAQVRLPSGEIRRINVNCMATIGQVSNLDHENVSLGKAGRNRWLGFRPTVRGTAMNPVDHPHGGGEGRSKGNHPMSPWGQPTRGFKTRRKKPSDKFIVQRRKG